MNSNANTPQDESRITSILRHNLTKPANWDQMSPAEQSALQEQRGRAVQQVLIDEVNRTFGFPVANEANRVQARLEAARVVEGLNRLREQKEAQKEAAKLR